MDLRREHFYFSKYRKVISIVQLYTCFVLQNYWQILQRAVDMYPEYKHMTLASATTTWERNIALYNKGVNDVHQRIRIC